MATILVIEDNAANMKLAALLLERAGHRVLRAFDAETGMALARGRQPDLILMDIQLPDMDGLTATRKLKQDAATHAIKVLALTGFAMQGDEQKILAAGCNGYIAKPICHESFLQAINRALLPG